MLTSNVLKQTKPLSWSFLSALDLLIKIEEYVFISCIIFFIYFDAIFFSVAGIQEGSECTKCKNDWALRVAIALLYVLCALLTIAVAVLGYKGRKSSWHWLWRSHSHTHLSFAVMGIILHDCSFSPLCFHNKICKSTKVQHRPFLLFHILSS